MITKMNAAICSCVREGELKHHTLLSRIPEISMSTMEQTLPDGTTYMTTLNNTIIDKAGKMDRLTTVVCCFCGINYTSIFKDLNAIFHCHSMRTWRLGYPRGGDLFVYMTCYLCAEGRMDVIADETKIRDNCLDMKTKLCILTPTSPEMNSDMYTEEIMIWGLMPNRTVIL
jgi:hypothetical protein